MERYAGPIEIGMRFVWEPVKSDAAEQIEVTRIDYGADERQIWSKRVGGEPFMGGDSKSRIDTWNEESQFRLAVRPLDDPAKANASE